MRRLLTGLYPFSIGLSVLPMGLPVLLIRGLAIGSTAAGIEASHRVGAPHKIWALLLCGLVAASAISALYAVDVDVAMADLVRQGLIVVIAFCMASALTYESSRRWFLAGLLGVAVVCSLVILLAYLSLVGPRIDLDSLPGFKLDAYNKYGVSINALSFAAAFAFVAGSCILDRKWLWPAGLFVAAAVLLSGSKTTLAAVAITVVFSFGALIAERSRIAFWFVTYVGGLIAATYSLALSFGVAPRFWLDPLTLSNVTNGRYDLWIAALGKFFDRPLVGWGGGSWTAQLAAYLPSSSSRSPDLLILDSGGAHNALLTLLAEKGVFAGIVAVSMLAFLVLCAVRLRGRASLLTGPDRRLARIAPFLIMFLMVRGLGEQPGLFGYANGAVDNLEFGVASIVVALTAVVLARREPGRGSLGGAT
jgi:O-antigen ligase